MLFLLPVTEEERELDCSHTDPAATELAFDVLVGADGLGSQVWQSVC